MPERVVAAHLLAQLVGVTIGVAVAGVTVDMGGMIGRRARFERGDHDLVGNASDER
jgi:hypothetical protein